MALNVEPNPAHFALAALAKKKPEFLTLTQNVDGTRSQQFLQSDLWRLTSARPQSKSGP